MPQITTPRGAIHYLRRGGPEDRLPLVLLHGAGGTARHWGYQLSGLAGALPLLAPDLPGHGRSLGPRPTSFARVVDQILAWLDALQVERAILAGHSMGGAIAQWLALYAPARVAALVLIGTSAHIRVPPAILEGLVSDFEATTHLIADLAYASATPLATLDQAAAELRAAGQDLLLADYRLSDGFDVLDDIPGFPAPTLVLCGAADRLIAPDESRRLHRLLPHSELIVVPGAGHMVMLEQPAAVNRAISIFLARHHFGTMPGP